MHIAGINGPQNVTVSGDEQTIDLLKWKLVEEDVAAQKFRTGVAYHSPQMEEIAAEHARCIQGLKNEIGQCSRRITMVSTTTGSAIQELEKLRTTEYLVSNMVQPVRSADAVNRTISPPRGTRKQIASKLDIVHNVIELGPHFALRLEYSAEDGGYVRVRALSKPTCARDSSGSLRTSMVLSGVDFILPDYQTEDCRKNSIMVASIDSGIPQSDPVKEDYIRCRRRVFNTSCCG